MNIDDIRKLSFSAHIPVLKKEIIDYFKPSVGKMFIDCTFGSGGHTSELLKHGSKVIAIDRDKNNEKFAIELQKKYGQNLIFINDRFSNLETILEQHNLLYKSSFKSNSKNNTQLDGILYDVGVSSMQIDEANRGFSFQKDGKLDMRMGCNSFSAEDLINKMSEKDLSDIIFRYGDERFSRKIAHAIVINRTKRPITSTIELADIISNCVPCHYNHNKIHPATRTFQALRIAVNNELQELEKSLSIASTLSPIGCIVSVITFHSLEDKIVKNIFQMHSKHEKQHFNRNSAEIFFQKNDNTSNITLKVITKKPIVPSDEEIKNNIRSRSAKLRIAERI